MATPWAMHWSRDTPNRDSAALRFGPTGHNRRVFDLINGLPVHPLVVHAAVVLIPLTLVGTILIAVRPAWRRTLGWWVVLLAAAALVTSVAAKESGEKFATRVGLPVTHADLGDVMPLFAFLMFAATTAYVVVGYLQDRKQAPASGTAAGGFAGQSVLVTVLAVVAVVVAIVATGWVIRVGDSGAKAVWEGRVEPLPTPTATSSSSPKPTSTPSKSATASPSSTAKTYTMAQVATHNTASDCWTVVSGKVYNVTSWESRHPGGAARIVAMCGIDATSAFQNQHDSQPRPNEELSGFQIGTLG